MTPYPFRLTIGYLFGSMLSMKGHKNGTRYRKLVDIGENPTDCWLWIGSINPRTGYGKKQWFGESWLAHRWVWTIFFGTIPHGMTIEHKCKNRACVNPHHLELMTLAENVRQGANTKLTAEQVREIRALNIPWGGRQAVADRFGVSPMTISDIRAGRSWRDIR